MPDLVAGFVLLLVTIMAVCSGLILLAVWLGDDRRPPPPRSNVRDVRGTIRAVLKANESDASPMATAKKGDDTAAKLRSRK